MLLSLSWCWCCSQLKSWQTVASSSFYFISCCRSSFRRISETTRKCGFLPVLRPGCHCQSVPSPFQAVPVPLRTTVRAQLIHEVRVWVSLPVLGLIGVYVDYVCVCVLSKPGWLDKWGVGGTLQIAVIGWGNKCSDFYMTEHELDRALVSSCVSYHLPADLSASSFCGEVYESSKTPKPTASALTL